MTDQKQTAKKGDVVRVHYRGTLDDGTEFDSSKGREPLQFVVGAGQMIQGFDKAVDGMELGSSVTVRIEAEEAYGPVRGDMLIQVPREHVPDDLGAEVGMQLEMAQPNGHAMQVTVREITEETVTLDANHPLAGQALTFEIELVEVGS